VKPKVLEFNHPHRGAVFYVGGIVASSPNLRAAQEVYDWCKENFGIEGVRWNRQMNGFWFDSEVDTVAFKLVWV
jgi:hypothetical protein